ncbi:MAG: GAF domain-containing protein [Myxococcota bacterium]
MTDSDEGERASDAPVDLLAEREQFVRTFLRKGVELTEELLRENQELRDELIRARDHSAQLLTQVRSDEAMRELLQTIERLEGEKRQLLSRSEQLEASRAHRDHRADSIERELNDLANLYVASHQLHTSLSVRRVIRHLHDTLGQLVGAEKFVIYAVDPEESQIIPIGWDGFANEEVLPVALGTGPIGESCLTGVSRIRSSADMSPEGDEDPLAVVPLLADGRPVGAIAIWRLLEQKSGWAKVDEELFSLLGAQAGMALIAANLYSRTHGPLTALAGIAEKL